MATSRIDGHKYALKVMKHRYSNLDKIKKDKEIKALKSLSHPHIIKLIDVLYDSAEGTSLCTQKRWRWCSNWWIATSTKCIKTRKRCSIWIRLDQWVTISWRLLISYTRRVSSIEISNLKIYWYQVIVR